ncbi:MAG TPA: hypothetical protein VF599_13545 [Pyrinomonadaceae bacterium]|jgi:hypothetical protein
MPGKFKKQIACAVVLLGFVSLSTAETAAQTRRKRNVLPRVGIVKNLDEIRDRIHDRCASHFIQPGIDMVRDEYIFISTRFINSSGNFDVVMNLDGRNVWLKPLATTLRYDTRERRAYARHEYRAGKTRVTVSFQVQPDSIYPHPAQIVVRNGNAARTIRAFVVEQYSGGE